VIFWPKGVYIGEKTGTNPFINRGKWNESAKGIFESINVNIDVEKKVAELTTAYVQLVEIARALAKDAKIIIMDEPTAPLSNHEVDGLFKTIQTLKARGVTIVYISHRIGEIFNISDRISVMRDGCKVADFVTAKTNRQELIFHMVNRKIEDNIPHREVKLGDVVLEAKKICGKGDIKVKDVSFTLKSGEILGLGGLVGSGRTEVSRLLFGADELTGGEILIDGKPVEITSPKSASKMGIGLVPEDRKHHGAILPMSIRSNISLPIVKRLSRYGFMDFKSEQEYAKEQFEALRIKAPSLGQMVKNLSGGNQQKVVVAKWLASKCRILILDEPTRGVDVGAKQDLYTLINKMAEQGIAILLISTEMEELLGLSDRLVVLCEGTMTGVIEREDFSQEKVLTLASGNM
jgi:ABC-type sugar transport system ATPase subunit